jgi:hypothetical protein
MQTFRDILLCAFPGHVQRVRLISMVWPGKADRLTRARAVTAANASGGAVFLTTILRKLGGRAGEYGAARLIPKLKAEDTASVSRRHVGLTIEEDNQFASYVREASLPQAPGGI